MRIFTFGRLRRCRRRRIGGPFLIGKVHLSLASPNDEGIVFAVTTPGAGRHIAYFDESPIRHVGWREAEMIANGWRNTQTCIMTCVRRWLLILKKMYGK